MDGNSYYDGGQVEYENNDNLSDTIATANVPNQRQINDNCIAVGLSVFNDYAIASVSLNDDWRLYPSDDNLMQLASLTPSEHIHFHYA